MAFVAVMLISMLNVSEMEKFRLIAGDYRCVCVSVIRSSEMINYLEIAIRVVWLIFL